MAAPKSRLGRGLGALIASGAAPAPKAATPPAAAPQKSAPKADASAGLPQPGGYREVPVAQIDPNPYQPRREIDPEPLKELVESIRSEGLLQPVVVRQVDGRFQLIAGERRWRAFQELQIKSIPARVIEATDTTSAALALIENLQREGLNPIEEAHGYASLIRDFDLTQEKASERVGKSRAGVANALRLLQLGAEIQGFISKGLLSVGHAKVLLGLTSDADRGLLARRIIEEGLNVRQVERIVQHRKAGGRVGRRGRVIPEAELAAVANIEKRLTSHLSARVQVRHSPRKGRIVIEYQGNSDLQRLLEKLGVEA
jgi:ParB family transcriptional regulator, chromosome partitioning protein